MGGQEAILSVKKMIVDIVNTIVDHERKCGLRYLDRFGWPVRW
jgi:hypothetical protein